MANPAKAYLATQIETTTQGELLLMLYEAAIKFLKQHNKVKFTVRFRGRQMAHKELGYNVLEKIKTDLAHLADVDAEPVADRNLLFIIMSPKKDIDRILEKMGKTAEEAPAVPAPSDQTQEQ